MSNIGIIRDVFSTEQIEELLSKFMSSEMLAGPHGTKHALRTMLIAGKILAEMPESADATVVMCASTLHDVGRVSDGSDPLHGFRGVPRVLEIMDLIRNPDYPEPETGAWEVVKGKVANIVANHCFPGFGVGIDAQVAGDADRLDILRMGPGKLDPSRLALNHSRDLIPWVLDLLKDYR